MRTSIETMTDRQRDSRVLLFAFAALAATVAGACDSSVESKPAAQGDAARSEEAAGKDAAGEEASRAGNPSEFSRDWPSEPIAKVEAEIDGVGFSLSLPDKLGQEIQERDDETSPHVAWTTANSLLDPSFVVTMPRFPPSDLESAATKASNKGREVVQQQSLDGGGFMVSVVEDTKKYVAVNAWQPTGTDGKMLQLSVSVRSSKPLENLDALRAWLESVVGSFRTSPPG